MPRLSLLIFDGDDTLWSTMVLYREAKAAFCRLVEAEGLDPVHAGTLLDAIDVARVSVYGFSADRFPLSMVDTYIQLCARAGRTPCETVAQGARRIGMSVFDRVPIVVDRAAETLADLSTAHQLVLCTKGDRSVQEARLAVSGLQPFFTRVYIPATKGREEFANILDDHGVEPLAACSIGNSIPSDITPPLDLGMFAIWIPSDTWSIEEAPPPESVRLRAVTSLRDVPTTLAEIEGMPTGLASRR
jgi:putative hydrolase of the HAD superfamily